MNRLADADRALLMDGAGRDIVALCALEEDGTVAVRGALSGLPDAGTAEALWAGWGPAPDRRAAGYTAGAGTPWLVTLEQGDLRVWMGARRSNDAGGDPGGAWTWWFARPLAGTPVRSATACFELTPGTIYIPYLARGDGDAGGGLRVLWFRSGWRDEPAALPGGAAHLLQAAAWSTGPGSFPRLVLFWLDESGRCRWGLWRRLEHETWDLEHAGSLGGDPPGADAAAARRWHRLWLAPVPGGGASAIALAEAGPARARMGGRAPEAAGGPLLARLEVAADGTPRYLEYLLAGETAPRPGRSMPVAGGDRSGYPDLAGWWVEGDAALVLLSWWEGDGASVAVEGWLLPPRGAARRLGAVPASSRSRLAVARVAAAGTGPLTPCRLPLLEDAGGHARPWPVPSGWLDALRASVSATAMLPARGAGAPVLPAPARPAAIQPVPSGHAWPVPASGQQPPPAGPEVEIGAGPTLGRPARPPLPRERQQRESGPGSGLPASEPAPRPRWRVIRQRSS